MHKDILKLSDFVSELEMSFCGINISFGISKFIILKLMSYVLQLPVWIDNMEKVLMNHDLLDEVKRPENAWVQAFL